MHFQQSFGETKSKSANLCIRWSKVLHFLQTLRGTKLKSAKFYIRWSKVPHVLGPLNRVMTVLVTRPATAGGSFQAEKHPKWQSIAISWGYMHFEQTLRKTKLKRAEFRM